MVLYLSDLMEDATDFLWQGAKAEKWRKGLIGSGRHMTKSTFQVGKHGVGLIPRSHCSANIFRQMLACSRSTMRPMVVCIDIFVRFDSPRGNS